jgi:hypothetical protein
VPQIVSLIAYLSIISHFLVLSPHECGLEIHNMMITIVTNTGQCNQVIPVLLFVGIVFILIGLGCMQPQAG